MDCRRKVLGKVDVGRGTHLGLWLDKGLAAQPDNNGNNGNLRTPLQQATDQLLKEVEQIVRRPPSGYGLHLLRLKDTASRVAAAGSATLCEATVQGRMVVGLGAKNAMEFGIHLDHTWGVPVIPGSSLKGIAAAAAHQFADDQTWRPGGAHYQWLFGTGADAEEANRGAVHFWDAWWLPAKDDAPIPVHRDVMTVHHKDYYQKDDVPPSDMDEPTPIPFLSASGTYLVVVEGEPEWRDAALTFLKKGLVEHGVGAKTNAGYGRLKLQWESAAGAGTANAAQPQSAGANDGEAALQALLTQAKSVKRGTAEQQVPKLLQDASGYGAAAQRQIAEQLVKTLEKKWLKDRPWAKPLLDILGG